MGRRRVALVGSMVMVLVLPACGSSSGGSANGGSSNTGDHGADVVTLDDHGVGSIEVGMSIDEVKASGLVQQIQEIPEICMGAPIADLGDKGEKSWGSVVFFDDKAASIMVTGEGATTKDGVSIGDTVDDLDRVYGDQTEVALDEMPVEVFGYISAAVTFDDESRGAIEFFVDPETNEIGMIGIPYIQTCD